jgi:hypothetical protein|tara:strand:+ start:4217 stop:5644 length:1428 start_codon:yes stop_codon:yes gene_type:complete
MKKNFLFLDKINFFYILIFIFLTISLINNFYNIKKFDNYIFPSSGDPQHQMIKGDIKMFWMEGDQISDEIRGGKSFLETGGEYRRPYLPSKIYSLYSFILQEDIYDNKKNIVLGKNKIFILFFQSILYYLLVLFFFKKLDIIFPKFISRTTTIFLCVEPTILFYHSSFWSESIFFSLQILIFIIIIKEKTNYRNIVSLGFLIALLYLQRSVAIFYFIPVLFFLFFRFKKNYLKISVIFLLSYVTILSFVGFHNYVRSGIFQITSTQAKDGFYNYLLPNILAEKLDITPNEAHKKLNLKINQWAEKNKINLEKTGPDLNDFKVNEKDQVDIYNYQQKETIKIFIENPYLSAKTILKKTIHFFVIDPFTHVYYFHRWNNDRGEFYSSHEHKKNIIPRIIYSLIIYFFCFLGIIYLYKNKYYQILFFLFTSILYYTLIQSWYGGTRYFAPILIYISLLFSSGLYVFFKRLISFKKKNY